MSGNKELVRTVFVLGFPRSGTTWISNLINAHPDVIYRHELFGRCHELIGEPVFSKLKNGEPLSDKQFTQAWDAAVSAHPETDRPPFFEKSYARQMSQRIKKSIWLLAKSNSVAAKLYTYLYTPHEFAGATLVIKETRSSINLDSIVRGMQADKVVVLMRHPYSVIASHVSGRSSGSMGEIGRDRRATWFANHKDADYVIQQGIELDGVRSMSAVEFLALDWLLQNSDYLAFMATLNVRVFPYELFLEQPQKLTAELYEFLGLQVTEQVSEFVADSTSEEDVPLMKKDSSNEFFSVYRGKSFDPHKWKTVLSDEQTALIDKHCDSFLKELGLFDLSAYQKTSDS